MTKIVLDDTSSGYSLAKINENFNRLEDHLNNKVFYRDNPAGQANELHCDLDANGHRIYNLPAPALPSEAARLQDIINAIGNQATANLTAFTPYKTISATNVQLAIQQVFDKIQSFLNNIAALRLVDKTAVASVMVLGYYSPGDGGGGVYWYDSSDTTSVDNGGTVIVANDGGRWKLKVFQDISVKQFGAKGDNTTNDTAAIQACFNWANVNGRTAYMPKGFYRATSQIVVDNSADTVFPSCRMNLKGDGPRNSLINWDNGASSGLAFVGSTVNGGIISEQFIRDIALLKSDNLGDGLDQVANALFYMDNVYINGFQTGLVMQDCLSCTIYNSRFRFNSLGVSAFRSTFSQPNAITFMGCTAGNNLNFGIDIKNPGVFKWLGGSIENNNGGVQPVQFAARITVDTFMEASVSAIFDGVYFENNAGAGGAEAVWYINNVMPATFEMRNCTINRGLPYFGDHALRVDTTNGFTQKIVVSGCGFAGFNGYTPNVNRNLIHFTNPNEPAELIELGNTWGNLSVEAPNYATMANLPPVVVCDKATNGGYVRFNGTTGAITSAFGVTNVNRTGPGTYTITFARAQPAAGTRCYSYMLNTAGVAAFNTEGANTFQVTTFNPGFSLADFSTVMISWTGGGQ